MLFYTPKEIWPAPLVILPSGSSSSWQTRAGFLIIISAVLFAVPAANTDLGKEGFCRRVEVLPLPFSASPQDSSSLRLVFFPAPCPLFLLSACLTPGLGFLSLVHRKRADRGCCDDLHREVFSVVKAELPCWQKVWKGLWHILTVNIMVEPILGCLTSGLVRTEYKLCYSLIFSFVSVINQLLFFILKTVRTPVFQPQNTCC